MKSKPLKSEKDRKAACLAKQNSETHLVKTPSKAREAPVLDNKIATETSDVGLNLQKSSSTQVRNNLTDSKPLRPEEYQNIVRPTSFEQQSSA